MISRSRRERRSLVSFMCVDERQTSLTRYERHMSLVKRLQQHRAQPRLRVPFDLRLERPDVVDGAKRFDVLQPRAEGRYQCLRFATGPCEEPQDRTWGT